MLHALPRLFSGIWYLNILLSFRISYSLFYPTVLFSQEVYYIKKQLEEDKIADQMSLKEYIDPFTGGKETKA